jgi:hypothetical protein
MELAQLFETLEGLKEIAVRNPDASTREEAVGKLIKLLSRITPEDMKGVAKTFFERLQRSLERASYPNSPSLQARIQIAAVIIDRLLGRFSSMDLSVHPSASFFRSSRPVIPNKPRNVGIEVPYPLGVTNNPMPGQQSRQRPVGVQRPATRMRQPVA